MDRLVGNRIGATLPPTWGIGLHVRDTVISEMALRQAASICAMRRSRSVSLHGNRKDESSARARDGVGQHHVPGSCCAAHTVGAPLTGRDLRGQQWRLSPQAIWGRAAPGKTKRGGSRLSGRQEPHQAEA